MNHILCADLYVYLVYVWNIFPFSPVHFCRPDIFIFYTFYISSPGTVGWSELAKQKTRQQVWWRIASPLPLEKEMGRGKDSGCGLVAGPFISGSHLRMAFYLAGGIACHVQATRKIPSPLWKRLQEIHFRISQGWVEVSKTGMVLRDSPASSASALQHIANIDTVILVITIFTALIKILILIHTLDGCEILHQLVDGLSHYNPIVS